MFCLLDRCRRALAALMMVTSCLLLVSTLWPWPWPWPPLALSPWLAVAVHTLLVLLSPLLLLQARAGLRSWGARRKSEALRGRIEDMLTAATRSMDVAAKCVRFIQESELVARGFTL